MLTEIKTREEYDAFVERYRAQFPTLDAQLAEHERILKLCTDNDILPNRFFLAMIDLMRVRRDDEIDTPLTMHQMRGVVYQLGVLEKSGVNP